MARTTLTPKAAPGCYLGETQAANSLDFVFTAADVPNKNQFAATGKELLLVINSDPTNPYTFTVTSFPDEQGRKADITTYSLAAGEYAVFGPVEIPGWRQADGMVYLEGENAAIKFAVIRLP